MAEKNAFTFIDLFAGIGGFHQAMKKLGGKCVFACDINEDCRNVYKKNFCQNDEFLLEGDIKNSIKNNAIPKFDVLCAGFPCQTFSKSGHRTGFEIVEKENGEKDERGQLFFRIIDILKEHPECKYFILENVRNLADNKVNWNIVCSELKKQNFVITEEPIIESPENFNIPQTRERVYILGIKKGLVTGKEKITRSDLKLEKKYKHFNENCIEWIIDKNVNPKYIIEDDSEIATLLNVWEEFLQELRRTETIKSPFWLFHAGVGKEFDLDYIFSGEYDWEKIPRWKQCLLFKSRVMYTSNKEFIDEWIDKYNMTQRFLIHQKFEWNASKDCQSIKQGIIQIRQSGIRVKSPSVFPSLVAMNNTPIIWDNNINKYRYLSVRECAKLQSFKSDFKFSNNDNISYRQLGNSVNVKVIKIIAEGLFNIKED